MKPIRLAPALTVALAATLAATACGRVPTTLLRPGAPAAQPDGSSLYSPLDATNPPATSLGTTPDMSAKEHRAKILASLELTADQKTQLKAIKAKYKDQGFRPLLMAHVASISVLLTAPTVDKAALKAEYTQLETDWKAALPTCAAAAGEMRDVLTAEQRTKVGTLLGKIEAKVPTLMDKHIAKWTPRVTADLSLTTEQQASLKALQDQVRPIKEKQATTAIEALATFVADGDQPALVTKLGSLVGQVDYGASIDWLAGLTLTQRQTLAAKIPVYLKEHMADHGMQ